MTRRDALRTALFGGLLLTGLLSGCSNPAIKQALENQRPKVSVGSAQLTGLTFDKVDLNFGIKVDNPNPIPINLAGLDYDLKLAGKSFLKGTNDQPIQVAASGVSQIDLPLSIGFNDLFNIFQNMKSADNAAYDLDLGLLVNVPVIGQYRQPLTTSGNIPIPKMPSIKLSNFSLDNLNLTGAKVGLALEVDNPNAFSLALDKLDYTLKVNGAQWFSGVQNNVGTINKNGKSTITLPLNLNFAELGMGLFQTLSGGKSLNYDIKGNLGATSDNALLGSFNLPINQSGNASLAR